MVWLLKRTAQNFQFKLFPSCIEQSYTWWFETYLWRYWLTTFDMQKIHLIYLRSTEGVGLLLKSECLSVLLLEKALVGCSCLVLAFRADRTDPLSKMVTKSTHFHHTTVTLIWTWTSNSSKQKDCKAFLFFLLLLAKAISEKAWNASD